VYEVDREKLPELLVRIIERALSVGATDIHLRPGKYVHYRVAKRIISETEFGLMDEGQILEFATAMVGDRVNGMQRQIETSFNYNAEGSGRARFRLTIFRTLGRLAISLRYVPYRVPTLAQLHLPEELKRVLSFESGLVLVVGPTGSGKTTTLAALVDLINTKKELHILTLEDPVEYFFDDKRSLITQRTLDTDAPDFRVMLREALREDPNVILIGEMRDMRDFEFGIQAADSGHLVLAALHTVDAIQTIHRIVDAFPPIAQRQIRESLASTLRAVFAQRLLPRKDRSGVVPAVEILWGDHAEKLIRENSIDQIYDVMKNGAGTGMRTLNQAIAELVRRGMVAPEDAIAATHRPKELSLMLKGFSVLGTGGQDAWWQE
jgi:twitching motility protein PilT